MTIISALAVTAAVAAGTAGAVTAYQLASPEPTTSPTAAVASNDDRSGPDRTRFAPCEKPATLEHRRCVRAVTRTVVVPQSAPSAPAAPTRHGDDSGFAGSDDARRDFADDELAAVADDDDDADDFGTGTRTRTRTGHAAGTGTNTGGTNTGGTGLDTSTRTRTGHSGTSG
jgi:hypothetical protein